MPVIIYSVLRLGLFALALVGLWLAGMGGWLLVVLAAVVAWALSYVLLAARRDAAARWIADRRSAGRPRFSPAVEADAAAEDAAAEGRSDG
jgi:hypothetical protein